MELRQTVRKWRSMLHQAKSVYKGFQILEQTNRTPDSSYHAMRSLFIATKGRSNNIISSLISKKRYADISINGVLGLKSKADLQQVVSSINEKGYHVFENKLPEHIREALYNYAKSTPCKYLEVGTGEGGYSREPVVFDEENIISPRYQFSPQQIIENTLLQELMFDRSLLAVAQEYLGTKPILDLVAMWWSAPFQGKGKSDAAQMYHFDLDRIKFLKFFFYLTDVDTETGPHCYVRTSHRKLPSSLLKEGRLTDEEVLEAFGKENLVELCGKKGTIMAVDTRGLHKGKELTKDKRLIFQIEFANSMFGQYYSPCNKPLLSDELENTYTTYKYTYQEIMS